MSLWSSFKSIVRAEYMLLYFLCLSTIHPPVVAYETVEDAALIARTLVDVSKNSIATMATVFPSDDQELAGQPFSMQEYYASCYQNGSLTLLFLPISRHSRNIYRSREHHASISITSEVPAASRARVSLLGTVTVFDGEETIPDLERIKSCYLAKHPDARWWLPDEDDAAHVAYWARFDPHAIYFVGGFGDTHYIGYIPTDLYSSTVPQPSLSSIAGRLLVAQEAL